MLRALISEANYSACTDSLASFDDHSYNIRGVLEGRGGRIVTNVQPCLASYTSLSTVLASCKIGVTGSSVTV